MDLNKRPHGKLVLTQTGKTGKVFSDAEVRHGKQVVRLSDGSLILCEPNTLRQYGYFG